MDFLLHHMLWSSADSLPDKEAAVHGKHRMTYEEFADQTMGLAYGLRQAGLKRGERIGIFLEPSIHQPLCIFAISQAGGVFVPIHHTLFPEQLAYIIKDCGIRVLITDESKLSKLTNTLSACRSLNFVVVTTPGVLPAIDVAVYEFEELCQTASGQPWVDFGIEKDLAAILYTSGSTGKPKGVMLSHANIMAGASIVSTYLRITDTDRNLVVLPFSFDAGLNQFMTTVQQGGTLVLTNFLFARDIAEILLKERITGLAGVPTLWSMLVSSSTIQHKQFPDLRYITNTGGAIPRNVLATLREVLPTTKIFLMYGLTEAFRSTYLPPEELERRPTSIGKAVPNTEIFLVNDEGHQCKPGEVGELVHHGPTVSLGYWGQSELSKKVLRPHPFPPAGLSEKPEVCYSGDYVKMDEEGYMYFVGRRDDLIKSAGFRISSTEVEDILYQSGKLKEAAVIGVPDQVLGQHVKAFVVTRGDVSVCPDELLEFCATKMPSHMVPKSIEQLDALPKNSNDKIDYQSLRRGEGL